MITTKQKQALEARFGTEHPDFPISDWYARVFTDGYLDGYWQYVWDRLHVRKPKQVTPFIADPDLRREYKQLRLAARRGFTEDELLEFLDAGHNYADAGRRFNCTAQHARYVALQCRKRKLTRIRLPKSDKQLRAMPLAEFSKLPFFTARTSRYLRVSNHYDFKDQGTVDDLIKQGLLWQPNFGKKTLIEIRHILVSRLNIAEKELDVVRAPRF